jgi:23S rRNA (adenine2503-C2)-methyltransferase
MSKNNKEKRNLIGMPEQELIALFATFQEKKFRAIQLMDWIYNKNIFDFALMSNFSDKLRSTLKSNCRIFVPTPEISVKSKDGETIKLSLLLDDGKIIETVLIGSTICLSSQVGCGAGCIICRTGSMGLTRNLETSEIVGQILAFRKYYPDKSITNVVFMGMGEPLHNVDNVVAAIELINNPKGFNIGMRRITLSTVGVVPAMEKLAEKRLQLTLAVSLHAATNPLRDKIVPINRRYPLQYLLAASQFWFDKTGRRVTFEIVLVKDLNDSRKDALAVVNLLKGLNVHVNLIAFNPFPGTELVPPSRETILDFQKDLTRHNIPTTIRASRGDEILAACGQLAVTKE